MNPQERSSLAEQLLTNPLFADVFDGLEKRAIEAMIYASTDDDRRYGAHRVQAIRSFRQDCEAQLRNTREPRSAPA